MQSKKLKGELPRFAIFTGSENYKQRFASGCTVRFSLKQGMSLDNIIRNDGI